MEILLGLLKAFGGLFVVAAAGFALWKAATRKATLETARDIQEKEDEHMTHYKKQADAIRDDDITQPDNWL